MVLKTVEAVEKFITFFLLLIVSDWLENHDRKLTEIKFCAEKFLKAVFTSFYDYRYYPFFLLLSLIPLSFVIIIFVKCSRVILKMSNVVILIPSLSSSMVPA